MRQGLGKSARWAEECVQERTGWTLKNSKDGDTTVSLSSLPLLIYAENVFPYVQSESPSCN